MKKIEFTEDELISIWHVLTEVRNNVEYDDDLETYFTEEGFTLSIDKEDIKNLDNVIKRVDKNIQ